MQFKRYALVIILILSTLMNHAQDIPYNQLYAQCTFSTMQDAPSIDEMGYLLKELGFHGIEAWGKRNFYQTREAAEKTGISLTANYLPLYIRTNKDYSEWEVETRRMIRSSEKSTLFCFHIPVIESTVGQRETEKIVVEVLSEMAEYAADYDVKICTYPHVGSYCETVSHSVKLAKAVDRTNCGSMLTLCHLLKVEGTKNISRTLKKSRDYLFAVTISGADEGNTMEMNWDRLIQPLGEGSFDTYHFLEQLWDLGYDGPVGVQYYGIKADARTVIRSSVQAWQNYRKEYINTYDHDQNQ